MATNQPNVDPNGKIFGIDPREFLGRAAKPSKPGPWPGVFFTIGAPFVAIVVGFALLLAINIGKDSAAYTTPRYAAVRTALTQGLDRDLTAARLEEILAKTEDPSPYIPPKKTTAAAVIDKGKAARLAERTPDIKAVAARLYADRAQLVEELTRLAMTAPLNEKPLETRLNDRSATDAVRNAIKDWVSIALDPWTAAAMTRSVRPGMAANGPPIEASTVVATAIHGSLGLGQPLLNVKAAMTPRFDAFTVKAGESWWTNDVAARLTWAVVTLAFMMTFAMAAIASFSQLLKIGDGWRWTFIDATLVAAVVAGAVAHLVLSPAGDPTPLHRALNDFDLALNVQIVEWSVFVNVLRAVGVVLLIAGSVATFSLEITTIDQLNEQLRGFKAIFNAGTFFLLSGVLEIYALFRWPIAFAADEPTRTLLNGAASTFATSIGMLFTVVLLAAYIATTVIVRRHATENSKITKDQVEKALTEFGFGDLMSQQGLRLAQALLPLLPGITNIFTKGA